MVRVDVIRLLIGATTKLAPASRALEWVRVAVEGVEETAFVDAHVLLDFEQRLLEEIGDDFVVRIARRATVFGALQPMAALSKQHALKLKLFAKDPLEMFKLVPIGRADAVRNLGVFEVSDAPPRGCRVVMEDVPAAMRASRAWRLFARGHLLGLLDLIGVSGRVVDEVPGAEERMSLLVSW